MEDKKPNDQYSTQQLKEMLKPLEYHNGDPLGCIDGRCAEENIFRVPWGGIGVLMAVLGDLKGQIDRNIVFKKWQEIVGFSGHTDTHANDVNNPCSGCGHIKNGLSNAENYGLTDEDLELILNNINENKDKIVPYEGEHEEKTIVIVDGNLVLKPASDYFIFNKTVFNDLIEKIIRASAEEAGLPDEEILNLVESAKKSGENQLSNTVKKIASGKPIIEISK